MLIILRMQWENGICRLRINRRQLGHILRTCVWGVIKHLFLMKKRATFTSKVARFRPVNDRLMIWKQYVLFCLQSAFYLLLFWAFVNENSVFPLWFFCRFIWRAVLAGVFWVFLYVKIFFAAAMFFAVSGYCVFCLCCVLQHEICRDVRFFCCLFE